MFSIYFTSFYYGPSERWNTLDAALDAARGYGWESSISHNGTIVGTWSYFRGYSPL